MSGRTCMSVYLKPLEAAYELLGLCLTHSVLYVLFCFPRALRILYICMHVRVCVCIRACSCGVHKKISNKLSPREYRKTFTVFDHNFSAGFFSRAKGLHYRKVSPFAEEFDAALFLVLPNGKNALHLRANACDGKNIDGSRAAHVCKKPRTLRI